MGSAEIVRAGLEFWGPKAAAAWADWQATQETVAGLHAQLASLPCAVERDRAELVDHLAAIHGVLVAKRMFDADVRRIHAEAQAEEAAA